MHILEISISSLNHFIARTTKTPKSAVKKFALKIEIFKKGYPSKNANNKICAPVIDILK
jgi:hypothetical protein